MFMTWLQNAKEETFTTVYYTNHNLLPLSDGQLRVEVCRRGLDPVNVPHEDGVLELDVGFVLVLQLLWVDGSNPGTKLKISYEFTF